ncbi:NRAMP family divalent metal transporter [Pleomorphovibrio marinus]|uniref:NRAMP family divalent metal transporter n=1 Tax=Pleomorphovibrio marinus TaxID=2164132 RepID=UPI000E0C201B|nr:divalent metal cation transporter [Pleomorphovibrio marinus]
MGQNWGFKNFLKTLGPGILFASTAIGVSHLVQSSRAGAEYGFGLVFFILFANIFKWPFFEFGSRYATATGRSLIAGYHKANHWFSYLYLGINLLSMFFVNAAVTMVTAGFLQNLFEIPLDEKNFFLPSLLLFLFSYLFLSLGRYSLLDKGIKVIGSFMLISTLLAFAIAVWKGPESPNILRTIPPLPSMESLPFIIALMGWMPSAIDSSTWNSLWTIARIRQSKYTPSIKETVLEFNIGFWVSALLSICFMVMGAFLLFDTGKVLPDNNVGFATGIVQLYTANLGQWTFYIIAAAGFTIMLGTCIGVMDGYARSTAEVIAVIRNTSASSRSYLVWLTVTALGGFAVIAFFLNQFNLLIGIATTISFLLAPIIAILNYKMVFGTHLLPSQKPGKGMKLLALAGIVFLSFFSLGIILLQVFQ